MRSRNTGGGGRGRGIAATLLGLALLGRSLPATATIFWAEFDGTGWSGTANDDGSGVNRSLVTGQNYAKQVLFNSGNTRLYFAGQFGIRSSKLDGTDVQYARAWNDSGGLLVDPGTGMLYWKNYTTIKRGGIDGSAAVDIVTGRTAVMGTALDLANGKIYWTDSNGGFGAGGVYRANLDGSNIETLIATGQFWIKEIELDVANGKMYWTYNGGVRRANLDGSTIEQVVSVGDGYGLALDMANGNAYCVPVGGANAAINKITNFRAASPTMTEVVATGGGYISGITYVPPPPAPPPTGAVLVVK